MNSEYDAKPTEIAREALKRLAQSKIPPTPDNFHKVYNQITGNSPTQVSEVYARMLIELAKEFPRHTQRLLDCANTLEKAAQDRNWLKYKTILTQFFAADESRAEGLDTTQPNGSQMTAAATAFDVGVHDDVNHQLVELLSRLLEYTAVALKQDASIVETAGVLAVQVRNIRNNKEMQQFRQSLEQFCSGLESYGEHCNILQQGLCRLLNMLINSTEQLLSEDQWAKAQIADVRESMSDTLNIETITQAEQSLKEIIQRESQVKDRLTEARVIIKQAAVSLISNLEEISNETGDYHDKLEHFSGKVNQSNGIEDLSLLIDAIIQETMQVKKNVSVYRDVILTSRAEVRSALRQVNQLETKLQEMNTKMHEDYLTGVLNRRGFDDAYQRAVSMANREHKPVCFALLDIDDFKKLNDTYGHDVGDNVLIYLVEAVKEIVRLEDIVSRYGGEEFTILLPNVALDQAATVILRIRRHLTKKFFLYENKRILVTFSAGVAQYQPGETQPSLYKRADKALYIAKANGKNQVVTENELPRLEAE